MDRTKDAVFVCSKAVAMGCDVFEIDDEVQVVAYATLPRGSGTKHASSVRSGGPANRNASETIWPSTKRIINRARPDDLSAKRCVSDEGK